MAAVDFGDDSEFAAAVKAGRWPSPEVLDRVAAAHHQQATALRTAYNTSCDVHRPRLQEALEGQAGDAQLAEHNANVNLWDTHADLYTTSGHAVGNAAGELRALQHDLRLLIADKEPQYHAALQSRKPVAAQAILTETLTEADDMVTKRTGTATMYVRGVDFTAPLPERPATDATGQNGSGGNPHHDKRTDPDKSDGQAGGENSSSTDGQYQAQSQRDVRTDLPSGATASDPDVSGSSHDIRTDLPPGAPPNGATSPLNQVPQFLGGSMGRAASGGGSAGGGGSGISGLGSGLNPGLGGLGSGMPTSPASSLPSAPAAQSAASPMANAGSSFQSGLASGMGATAPPPVAAQPIAQQAMAAQQPLMGSPAAGSGPAGVPIAPHGVPDGGGGGPVPGGSGGGPVGGAPMMPPPAMAAGPLAPYSAPGAGAPPAGGGAPTTPAAAGQSSSGGPGPAAGGGSGLAAPGPLVAGGSGSGAAAGGLGASASEVNPDLLLAQRVLGELVRGSASYPTLVWWAVSVLRLPVGAQVVIASNIGDGGYVPAAVFLPATARLAVADPAVPFGWGQRWMGNRHPAKALVDHFEHVSKKVAAVSMSALVTNESWADKPACARDFLVVNHLDALNMLSEAPKLDGWHQHRLVALDPGLAQRLAALVERGYAPDWVAGQLTVSVIAAARQEPEVADCKLVTDDEINVLQAVHRGSADAATWQLYDQRADERYDGKLVIPETHGIDYVDGSELNKALATVYERYYRAGRIVEMVRAWKSSPPPLAEIAYCGVQAGFGAVVAAVISTLEMQAVQAAPQRSGVS
ncbi:hypothetical protein LFT50_30795 (plasmid) [Mycobacterium intracellulare subsp. chimaera]|nr:hypothetical protein [Mycobacterium intracellulare]UCN13096.1 hypothetical protein LFT50_30795 [Mycobacterium intracellulare subsp. chimaera]